MAVVAVGVAEAGTAVAGVGSAAAAMVMAAAATVAAEAVAQTGGCRLGCPRLPRSSLLRHQTSGPPRNIGSATPRGCSLPTT